MKASDMLVEVRSNKTVKYSNVHADWSYMLGCQSTLAHEPSSSKIRGTLIWVIAKDIKEDRQHEADQRWPLKVTFTWTRVF